MFNCSTSFINLSFKPNVYLNFKKIIFVKKVKYLDVLLENNLKDGIDINRQVRSFYYTVNKLKARFSKWSTFVKNVFILFALACMLVSCGPHIINTALNMYVLRIISITLI